MNILVLPVCFNVENYFWNFKYTKVYEIRKIQNVFEKFHKRYYCFC